MVKVLVTGFKHSGTTMLMRLLNAHPQVCKIEFETGYIEFKDKPPSWYKDRAKNSCPDMKNFVWGEKLPWGTRENDLKAERAIEFSKRWLKVFGKQTRILHIIRHPMDVALSRFPLPLDNCKIINEEALRYYQSSIPKYIDFLNGCDKCASIIYEEIMERPVDICKNTFEFLEIKSDEKTVKKVLDTVKLKTDRAYAFLNKGIECNIKYDPIWERINKRL